MGIKIKEWIYLWAKNRQWRSATRMDKEMEMDK